MNSIEKPIVIGDAARRYALINGFTHVHPLSKCEIICNSPEQRLEVVNRFKSHTYLGEVVKVGEGVNPIIMAHYEVWFNTQSRLHYFIHVAPNINPGKSIARDLYNENIVEMETFQQFRFAPITLLNQYGI